MTDHSATPTPVRNPRTTIKLEADGLSVRSVPARFHIAVPHATKPGALKVANRTADPTRLAALVRSLHRRGFPKVFVFAAGTLIATHRPGSPVLIPTDRKA